MLLQDSQQRSPNLSKNRSRINIPIVAWKYEDNIVPISQCYVVVNLVSCTCDLKLYIFAKTSREEDYYTNICFSKFVQF